MTAYDVRISGWSADVCSSDLASAGGFSTGGALAPASPGPAHLRFLPYGRINRPRSREKSMSRIKHGLSLVIGLLVGAAFMVSMSGSNADEPAQWTPPAKTIIAVVGDAANGFGTYYYDGKIGRASCREKVGQYG